MLFYTSLARVTSLSDSQFHRLVCELGLPKTTILKKSTQVLWIFSTLLFKNYMYALRFNKTAVSARMVMFFSRMRSLRGLHHLFHLPVNGQRSKTNANTQRRKGPHKKRTAVKLKKK